MDIPLPVSNDPEKAIIGIINAAENTEGFILSVIIADENIKSMLRFNVGQLGFSTTNGLEFAGESSFDFTKSEIGNTGLTLYFDLMKLDLSRTKNIPEATAAGYPDDFVGVFVKEAAIGLPKKWSKNTDGLSLVGRDLLGTGGFSGTVGLKSNGTTWANLGDNGFRVGFNSFDITFRQNAIVESNIRAKLVIPNFKDRTANGDFVIDVIGHLSENGDFNLTAALSPPLHANLFNFVNFDFKSFEIGRQGSDFYLGTSCDIWFPEDSVMHKIIEGQKITIPNLRIYSNGTFELVGGTACIPTNISLRLGPVNVGVTGINFGSYQRKTDVGNTGTEVMRQYNYFGFDGAISINPLGIDARGEGIKYYYTVDGGPKDSFLHIQTIEADLMIPGNVPAEKAAVIIHGMLFIPEPGTSPEYRGEISLKIPKAKIAAGASMRLAPKYPAFLVDAKNDSYLAAHSPYRLSA
ncbi:hypothetical protein LJC68_05775 [Bacteroidales bacterium OttesenSCG-928-B11]|nr:hypothetical protein [Bacteroidales bacterium OttesenSCG-928-B11]MDL2326588.1 hypothetical protein [Bacteroidales bacterium OttesenSCG-928-A14]